MSIAALRNAGGKPRREHNSVALIATMFTSATRAFGFFNDIENAIEAASW